MAGKKKASVNWRLAGEPVYPVPLSGVEEKVLSDCFAFHRAFRQRTSNPLFAVPASVVRNRESAARASLGFFFRRFGDKYQRHEIISAAAAAAVLPVQLAEEIADSMSFLLGAALWLLDYAEAGGTGSELLALLPEEPDEAVVLHVPMADDFAHSPDVICRLMTLLVRRKGAGRNAFRDVLRLIGKEAAAGLRNAFLDCFLDYFGRYMEVCTRVRSAAPPENRSILQPGFPLPPDFSSLGPDGVPAAADTSIEEDSPGIAFLLLTPMLVGAPEETLRSHLHFRRSVELMHGFGTEDPYAICAAYLLLEKEGDALASLNTLTCAVAACADQHLPWGGGELDMWPKATEAGRPDYTLRHTYTAGDGGAEEADGLPELPVEDGWRLSEAQLFYYATGCTLPRGCVPSRELAGWFVRQGLSEERAREFAFGAMLASYQDNLRELLELAMPFGGLDGEEEADEAEPFDAEECMAERIAELTRQVKELRRALHESEQAAKQLQEQLREDERRSAQDRTELSQLRGVLYRLRSGEAGSEPEEDARIEFPWRVTRRVLIFGGHETWLKAIRPLLPGARFFERESLPDLASIKGADAVWIQTNAISHKLFYRIINSARKENIPVRYFGYASARKCAEQLAADEQEETAAAES